MNKCSWPDQTRVGSLLNIAPPVVGSLTAGQGTISVAASFGLEDAGRPWVIALIVAGLKDFWRSARVWIEGLGPYSSLALLVAPACLVEPAKLVALAIIGEGHWMTGTLGIAAAYGVSIILIERLFTIVKPKLLRLCWFAKLWAKVIVLRYLLALPFRGKPRRSLPLSNAIAQQGIKTTAAQTPS